MSHIFSKNTVSQNDNSHFWIIIASAFIIIILVSISISVFLYAHRKDASIDRVKSTLSSVVKIMQSAKNSGNGYPASIDIETKGVKLNGGSSFDGKTYCYDAKSDDDNEVIYYADSSTNNPKPGKCTNESGLTPSVPGDIAVGFANSNQISISWIASVYANQYVLECSLDKNFTNAISIITNNLSGLCSDLQSGKLYYYRVKAKNNNSESDWSMASQIYTKAS